MGDIYFVLEFPVQSVQLLYDQLYRYLEEQILLPLLPEYSLFNNETKKGNMETTEITY